MRKLFVLTGLLPAMWVINAAAGPPSFDCNRAASQVEKAICSDEILSDMDRALSTLYRRFLDRYQGSYNYTREAARNLQRAWVRQRDRCNGHDEISGCIAEAYGKRIRELELAMDEGGEGDGFSAEQRKASELLKLSFQCGPGAGRRGIDAQQTRAHVKMEYLGTPEFFKVKVTEVAIGSDADGTYERSSWSTLLVPIERMPLPPKQEGSRLIFECPRGEPCFYSDSNFGPSLVSWADYNLCDAKTASNIATALNILQESP